VKSQETLTLDEKTYKFLKRQHPEKLKCTWARCKRGRLKAGQKVHRRRTTGGITKYYHIECWEVVEGI
jgi:hypothetical protein